MGGEKVHGDLIFTRILEVRSWILDMGQVLHVSKGGLSLPTSTFCHPGGNFLSIRHDIMLKRLLLSALPRKFGDVFYIWNTCDLFCN